jgi:hypothetical protein
LKRIALLAVIGGSLLALPGSASAACSDGAPIGVQNNATNVHVCSVIGDAEVAKDGSYGWVDGADSNPANSAGYAGYNTAFGPSSDCDGLDDSPLGTNDGGCFWIKGAPPIVNQTINDPDTPTSAVTNWFMCGNTSGPDHTSTTRDGCSIP